MSTTPDDEAFEMQLPALDVELDAEESNATDDVDLSLELPRFAEDEADSDGRQASSGAEAPHDFWTEELTLSATGTTWTGEDDTDVIVDDASDAVAFHESDGVELIDEAMTLGFDDAYEASTNLISGNDAAREVDDGGLEGLANDGDEGIDESLFPALDGAEDDDVDDDSLALELPPLEEPTSIV